MFKKKGKKGKHKDEELKKKKKKHKEEEDDEDEGKSKKKKAKKKKGKKRKKFVYAAPSDMKPFFMHILCRTGKDGLISDVEVIRWKGRPDNPKAKSIKLSEQDPTVLSTVAARLGATSFVTNPDKRLPSKTTFRMLCRVGKNKDDNVRFGIKEIVMKTETGKKTLKKKHPYYRRLRRCNRIMPAAFMKIGDFPKLKKAKKGKDDDE